MREPPRTGGLPAAEPGRAHASGCLACGAEIVYLLQAEPMTCSGCGEVRRSTARCLEGHYFCDRCHVGGTLDAILSTARLARRRLGTSLPERGVRCGFSPRNPDCHQDACPFHAPTGPTGAGPGGSREKRQDVRRPLDVG